MPVISVIFIRPTLMQLSSALDKTGVEALPSFPFMVTNALNSPTNTVHRATRCKLANAKLDP